MHRYTVRAGQLDRPAYSKRPADPSKPRKVANLPVPDPKWQLAEWAEAMGHQRGPHPDVEVTLHATIDRLTLRLTGAKLPTGFVTKIRTLTRPKKR